MIHVYSHCDITWGCGMMFGFLSSFFALCFIPLAFMTLGGFFVKATRVEALVALVCEWILAELKIGSGSESSGIIHFMCSAFFFWFSVVVGGCFPGVPTVALSEVVVFSFAVSLWGTMSFCLIPRSKHEWAGFFMSEYTSIINDSWSLYLAFILLFVTEFLCIFIRPLTLFLRVWANTIVGQIALSYCFGACISCVFLSSVFMKPFGLFYFFLSFILWFIELCLMTIHWGLFLMLVITYSNDHPMGRLIDHQQVFRSSMVSFRG